MWNSVKQCITFVCAFFICYFRSAVFLPCSARGELWRKPFLSRVLTSAMLGPILVQQTVSSGGLSSGAAWRKGEELILAECLE